MYDAQSMKPVLTVTEVAELLRISVKTVRRLLRSGRLHSTRIDPSGSSRHLIERFEIEQFMLRNRM